MVSALVSIVRAHHHHHHHRQLLFLFHHHRGHPPSIPPRTPIHRILLQQQQQSRRLTTTTTPFQRRPPLFHRRTCAVPKNNSNVISPPPCGGTAAAFLGSWDWSSIVLALYHDRPKKFRNPSSFCSEDEASTSTNNLFVLATSSSSLFLDSNKSRTVMSTIGSFWTRILDGLRRFLSQCRDVILVTLRGSEIVVRLVLPSVLILAPASILSSYYYNYYYHDDNNNSNTTNTNNWIADASWAYVRGAITELGPAFVKLGQWISTRRDLFPVHLCHRLAVLQDAGHAHAWKYTHQALQEAFGEDYPDRGLWVEPQPQNPQPSQQNAPGNSAAPWPGSGDDERLLIGCGSAAQVYRGTLRVVIHNKKKNSAEGDHHAAAAGSNDSTNTSSSTDTTNPIVQYRPVAIKVLHPHLQERIDRDLWFVETVARLLHDFVPSERVRMLNLPRAVASFGSILRRQADLTVEADNLKRFRRNFYSHNHDHDGNPQESKILFPRPIEGWISKNVLVEDLVENATPIAQFLNDSTEEGIKIRRELASPLLRAYLKMVFIDNLSHGDLHAGNVLVQTSVVERTTAKSWREKLLFPFVNMGKNTTSNDSESIQQEPLTEIRRQIVFLDAGIATTLSPNDQRNLLDLFRAVLLNDGNRAGRLMVERARYERCSQIPGGVEAFATGIQELVSEFHDRRRGEGLTLGAVRIGSLLSRVLDLCRVHGVEIDPAMASIVISTLVLEGLGRSLDPSLNLIDFAVPFVLGRGRV